MILSPIVPEPRVCLPLHPPVSTPGPGSSLLRTRWAAYCEMMRHKRWMSGSGGDGSAGSSSRAMMSVAPAGGPPIPPPWAAGEHPAWRYRCGGKESDGTLNAVYLTGRNQDNTYRREF